jgi:hypothetical protein
MLNYLESSKLALCHRYPQGEHNVCHLTWGLLLELHLWELSAAINWPRPALFNKDTCDSKHLNASGGNKEWNLKFYSFDFN